VSKLIARIRIDCVQCNLSGCSVVRVATPEALPVPLRAPGDNSLWPHLPDDADEFSTQLHITRPQPTLCETEEADIFDAEQCCCLLLLSAANARYIVTGNACVVATRLAVRQHTVGHGNTNVHPMRDSATSPEFGIVWMSDYHKGAFDFVLS